MGDNGGEIREKLTSVFSSRWCYPLKTTYSLFMTGLGLKTHVTAIGQLLVSRWSEE
jgi:hypothetical protein